jgi:hypothetical protein
MSRVPAHSARVALQRTRVLCAHLVAGPDVEALNQKANVIRPASEAASLPRFRTVDSDIVVSHFRETGIAIIEDALSAAEVAELNAFCDKSQRDGRWSNASSGEFSQPLMVTNELDRFVRHPSTFEIIEAILGGRGSSRFAQFDFRETAAGAPPQRMGLHRDRPYGQAPGWEQSPVDGTLYYEGEPVRSLSGPCPQIDYLCAITYLSDVTPGSPAFCVVPRSFRVPITAQHAAHEVAAQLGDEYAPVPIYGNAGTVVLYDIATFHTRADPLDNDGNRVLGTSRRTQHRYFGRVGACGVDAALTSWVLAPQRLAESCDATTKQFYSQWCPRMVEWASTGYSSDFLRDHAEELNLSQSCSSNP